MYGPKHKRNPIAKSLAAKSSQLLVLLGVKVPQNAGMAGSGIIDHHNEAGLKKISSSSR